MSKSKTSYSTLSWTNSASMREGTVLDKSASVLNNSEHSTSKIHDKLICVHGECSFYYRCNPAQSTTWSLMKTLNETKKAKTTKAAGGSQHARWIHYRFHTNCSRRFANLHTRSPCLTQTHPKRKRAVSVCLRRKSDVPRIKSQRFIIQVSHLFCYFRLIGNIDRIRIISGARKKRNPANSVPIFNAGVGSNPARRRQR